MLHAMTVRLGLYLVPFHALTYFLQHFDTLKSYIYNNLLSNLFIQLVPTTLSGSLLY